MLYLYILVDGFQHIVEGKRYDRCRVHRLYLYPCFINRMYFGGNDDFQILYLKINRSIFYRERMAVGNHIAGFLGSK